MIHYYVIRLNFPDIKELGGDLYVECRSGGGWVPPDTSPAPILPFVEWEIQLLAAKQRWTTRTPGFCQSGMEDFVPNSQFGCLGSRKALLFPSVRRAARRAEEDRRNESNQLGTFPTITNATHHHCRLIPQQ
eukprot:GHVU01042488.1.p1 GENE.GHVU01042488.1~~GHVU01042488.1.p1  ORF type:complete len:132 (+),score=13.48 GHVU01042488.1:1113-1508(+)